MLRLKDLIAHEKELVAIISHTQKELEAIRLLISGIQMRKTEDEPSQSVASAKSPGAAASVRQFIQDHAHGWFSGKDIIGWMTEKGYGGRGKRSSVRATVANYLKGYYDKGMLERKNVGSPESPKYEYRKRIERTLDLNT
ncbi:MAG: hypothetical protein ABIJ61_01230 [bacterium]